MKKADYTFKVDGFYHGINYYCSENAMNISSMPAPKTTGITTLTHTDTSLEDGKIYFVRFGSVVGTTEKISTSEVVFSTKPKITNLPLKTDVIDIGTSGKTWTKYGNATNSTALHPDGSLVLDGNGDYLDNASGAVMNLGTSDWMIEFEALWQDNGSTQLYEAVFTNRKNWGDGVAYCQRTKSTGKFEFTWRTGATIYAAIVDKVLNYGQWYKCKIVCRSGSVFAEVDGVRSSALATSGFGFDLSLMRIGQTYWNAGQGTMKGGIRNFVIYK